MPPSCSLIFHHKFSSILHAFSYMLFQYLQKAPYVIYVLNLLIFKILPVFVLRIQ